MKTTTTILAMLFTIATTAICTAADQYKIDVVDGKHAEIQTPEGQPLLRYMYDYDTSTKESTFNTAKVFAHVLDPDGQPLTKGAGGLYPHHRGIFIGWNKLKHGGKSHDLWHVRNTAQLHRDFTDNKTNASGAAIHSRIEWIGVDGKPVLSESREYAVSQPSGTYLQVDFSATLTAVGSDVELNGDPEHAGIQFRPSQKVAENKSAQYVFHEAQIDPKKDLDLPWVAETFTIDGADWTVQHMSHPSNPTGARWSAYRDYGRFGPFTVVKIPKDKSVTFKYRFLITKGQQTDRSALDKTYSQFAK